MIIVFLAVLMLPLQSFADTPYPFPVPTDFRNAPRRFVCEDPVLALRRETYYRIGDPVSLWIVSVDLRNGKEEMIMVTRRDSDKVYIKLFLFIDGTWKERMGLSEQEEQKFFGVPMGKEEQEFRLGCFHKQRQFQWDQNLPSTAY